MKTISVPVFLVFTTLFQSASAQSARCSTIRDHDQRMTCNAVTSGHKSWCGFVKEADKRAWCYVLVERK